MLAVSAGFDAYRGDPLAQETLEAEDYQWLGETIRESGNSRLSAFWKAATATQLPELIFAYLRGLAGAD